MKQTSQVLRNKKSIDFSLEGIENREDFEAVLMIEPEYFRVEEKLNSLTDEKNSVDSEAAWRQWRKLRDKYRQLGIEVFTIEGVEGLTDMVFAANQSFPYRENGQKKAIMSCMATSQRSPEVEHVERWYRENGFETFRIEDNKFEGMGDAIWHPHKNLIWGGYGQRTDEEVYEEISRRTESPVITLKLVKDEFYHLDTCFSALDEKTVLVCPEAFTQEGINKIKAIWENVIEVGLEEAIEGMACNAHCPDRKNVIIQEGNIKTNKKLKEEGFKIQEVDTSEFMKSGGSVFCMKLAIPR